MSDSPTLPGSSETGPDRRIVLFVFGSILLAIALIPLTLIAFQLVLFFHITSLSRTGTAAPMSTSTSFSVPEGMIPVLITCGLVVILLIILGLGSILLKRWSRPLILIGATTILYSSVIGLIGFVMPGATPRSPPASYYHEEKGASGTSSYSVETVAGPDSEGLEWILGLAAVCGFGIGVPGIFCLAYGLPSTKRTLERCDPQPCWTDRCPLPVLGLALGMTALAMNLPISFMYTGGLPLVNRIYEWSPLLLCAVAVVALLCLLSAGACYRLRLSGWILAVILIAGLGTLDLLTTHRIPAEDLFRNSAQGMNMPDDQAEAWLATPGLITEPSWVTDARWLAPILIFALWLLRYFRKPTPESSARAS